MQQIPVNVSGPDYYCPDCGRWLMKLNDAGTFDLAAQAGLDLRATVDLDALANGAPLDATAIDARCLRCHPETEGKKRKWRFWRR